MRTTLGTRKACACCGFDIEYHGNGVWLDRGGNTRCATSGAAPLRDQDGQPIPFPAHKRHNPR